MWRWSSGTETSAVPMSIPVRYPSKTLRENALQLDRYQRSSTILECKLREDLRVDHLIGRMHQVVESHVSFMSSHLERNHIQRHLGRARFVSEAAVEVMSPNGSTQRIGADVFVIATGSRPRIPRPRFQSTTNTSWTAIPYCP